MSFLKFIILFTFKSKFCRFKSQKKRKRNRRRRNTKFHLQTIHLMLIHRITLLRLPINEDDPRVEFFTGKKLKYVLHNCNCNFKYTNVCVGLLICWFYNKWMVMTILYDSFFRQCQIGKNGNFYRKNRWTWILVCRAVAVQNAVEQIVIALKKIS